MSDELIQKTYEGQPPETSMPEHPISGEMPTGMPMPSIMPDPEAAFEAVADAGAVIHMDDYPHGRGGMNTVPLSGDSGGETPSIDSSDPIGGQPPEMSMPS